MSISKALTGSGEVLIDNTSRASTQLEVFVEEPGVLIYDFEVEFPLVQTPSPITLTWKIPAIQAKGLWKSGSLYEKRIQYDWELNHLQSRVSINAPVVNIFGHQDENIFTIACGDAINMIEMNASLREEDNHFYCHITFFKEQHPAIASYQTQIRVDTRTIPYYQALQGVGGWWENLESYRPAFVPDLAKTPVYSTWYNFHQNMEEDILLKECVIAQDLGYDFIIIDDGWQTQDTSRGYDYTGDWVPERFPKMYELVEQLHQIGMKVGLWYSVPFCGAKSQAYQTFQGKFLTEKHRWAPVFDPRYPEVRAHLIEIYTKAVREWNLDAFKLDFIDDFKVYEETELTLDKGRDYANVNTAVDRLLGDVMASLRKIKPEIAIEFRQKYIGPNMRKYGNMFRAFDSPNDAVSNRIRITDVKILCGNTAVHSDMLTWHPEEPLEIAALQILNAFFGVPQISLNLRNLSEPYLRMIRFYTKFWREAQDTILQGQFKAHRPLANYPILEVSHSGHLLAALYEDLWLSVACQEYHTIDILNGKTSPAVLLNNLAKPIKVMETIWDCEGKVLSKKELTLPKGIIAFSVPTAGRLQLKKKQS